MSADATPDFSVPPKKERPSIVTYAGYAALAVGVLAIVNAIVGIIPLSTGLDAVDFEKMAEQASQDSNATVTADTLRSITTATLYGAILLVIIPAIVMAILAPFVLKGKNGARITMWIFAGFAALCCYNPALFALDSAEFTGADPEATKATEQAMDDAGLGWTVATQSVLNIVILLLILAVIVLLALPKSNDYFRKPPPEVVGLPPM